MTKDKSIFIQNIYHMLAYGFEALNQVAFADVEKEAFENLHNLYAAILANGIGYQLKQGLHRTYENQIEDMAVVRGKIHIAGTIKHKIAHRQRVDCSYDALTENNVFNQILKTTATLLLASDEVNAKYKNRLKKELLYFSAVDDIDPHRIQWASLSIGRNNGNYRVLISLCQLLLEGMLQTTENGHYKLAKFVDEQKMHHLYEAFILGYYRKEYGTRLSADRSQIPWAVDDGMKTMLPIMQSDITLAKDNRVLIIDAKYYTHTMQSQYDAHTIHSSHLYQIFTYVKNRDLSFGDVPHKVSGMLLYAQTDETMQPSHVYRMSGNTISVQTLDLNCSFSEISDQLNVIADGLLQSSV